MLMYARIILRCTNNGSRISTARWHSRTKHIDTDKILEVIDPKKDVDGFITGLNKLRNEVLKDQKLTNGEVLNGIAYNKKTNTSLSSKLFTTLGVILILFFVSPALWDLWWCDDTNRGGSCRGVLCSATCGIILSCHICSGALPRLCRKCAIISICRRGNRRCLYSELHRNF